MSFEIKRARSKTAVFSGTRLHIEGVLSLQELCIKKLHNNANKIECVGDVPFYILKTLLEKVTLAQLKRIESYNPHLVEDPDSDCVWRRHFERDFKEIYEREFLSKKDPRHLLPRPPPEGWRRLYKRLERERDHRIEKIAKRIKRQGEKTEPARQVRIVENQLTNGRRGAISTVIKKTIKRPIPANGYHSASSSNGSSSSSISSRPGNTITTTTVIRREAANGSSGSRLLKPKTAPLMQKSLQLFKSRFRR